MGGAPWLSGPQPEGATELPKKVKKEPKILREARAELAAERAHGLATVSGRQSRVDEDKPEPKGSGKSKERKSLQAPADKQQPAAAQPGESNGQKAKKKKKKRSEGKGKA
jgi:hypothetical protein